MSVEDKSGEFGRVLYFDPNNITINGDIGDNLSAIFKGAGLINNPEDYSIAVDLEVTNKKRGGVTSNDGKRNYTMINSQPTTNFLQGAELGGQRVLSSFFTDITYDNNDTTVQNEALCISSIDIEFSSWYVASVIVKFTDVRGSALFSPTEYLENNGYNQKISDGSLFSGFFTMPYPIFNLRIKGFYGESVTYPLHLQDFKAEFNTEKGNFDITAQFIGYTYAMLSDIQMTYLMAAPYSELYGVSYWNEQVNNGRFTTIEGSPLLKIPELLKKIEEGKFLTSEIKGSSETVKKKDLLTAKLTYITSIRSLIKQYTDALKVNYTVDGNEQTKFVISTRSESKNKTLTADMENDALIYPKIVNLNLIINQYINTYVDDNIFTSYKGEKAREYFQIKNITVKNGLYYGELNISEIINKINEFKEDIDSNIDDLGKQVAEAINGATIDTYKMFPSIYNFYKILLAHMETLLHIIGECANEINKSGDRGVASRMEETDFINNNLLPFPWFTYENKDEWIGRYHPNFSEVKLVKSLIKAKKDVTTQLEKIESVKPTTNGIPEEDVTVSVKDVWLPINAFDNSISNIGGKPVSPYSQIIKDSGADIREIKALLSTRIATILGLSINSKYSKNIFDAYILAESKNIIAQLGLTTNHIDKVIESLTNITKDYARNNDYTPLKSFKYTDNNNYAYEYNLLNTNGILPLTDDSISKLKTIIKNGKVTSDIRYYKYIKESNLKFGPTTLVITEGIKNCDTMYRAWYAPIESIVKSEKTLEPLLSRVKMEREDISKAFHNSSSELQPLMNRICYVKPEITTNWNNTIDSIYTNSGYKEVNGSDTEIKLKYTDDGYKLITYNGGNNQGFIFGAKNSKFKNLYKLYLGKDNWSEVEKIEISNLDRDKMFLKNSPDINTLTYPMIGGHLVVINSKQEAVLDNYMGPVCLFGSSIYYAQNNFIIGQQGKKATEALKKSRKAKAFLFLQTLPINILSFTDDIINIKNETKSFMIRMAKSEALLLGSMLWRRKYDNGKDVIFNTGNFMVTPDINRYFKINNIFTISSEEDNMFDECRVLKKIGLKSPLENKLITMFEDWCGDDSNPDGWIKIENALELHKPDIENNANKNRLMSQSEFITFINGYTKSPNSFYVRDNLHENVSVNYSIVEPINRYTLGLINRDKSPGVSAVLNLLFNECILSYTGDGIITTTKVNGISQDKSILTKANVDNFVTGLIDRLKEHRKTLTEITSKLPDQTVTPNSMSAVDSEDIELEVYKYLKILYDKWVSGYEFNTSESNYKWISSIKTKNNGYDTYDIKNFKFIDRSYHNIGDKFIIDYSYVLENLIGINEQKTLYTTITDILSKNNFLFMPMPNYQSWNTFEDFTKIFSPIPYSESNMLDNGDNKDLTSIFICMYTGEPSKRLNISNDNYEYKGDGLNLDSHEQYPPDFLSENNIDEYINSDNMNKVPAFAVSYGKQNQSYFKNITLNQNNPATTDATIGVLKNLISNNDKNAYATKLSQDMYTLYSQFSYTCQVEMLGCAQIQPMMYFQLTNIPMWNGAYLIYKVNHSIRPGHMTTNFTGMRMSKNYPKLLKQTLVSIDDLNTLTQTVAPKSDKISTLKADELIGKHFKLREYTTKNRTPETGNNVVFTFGKYYYENVYDYIVNRLQNNLAPTIDFIKETWDKSENGKKYGTFHITSGYRPGDQKQHGEGLAADIQLINNGTVREANEALFQHIRGLMRGGLKMDQLINEKDGGYWCHVSPIYSNDSVIKVRGESLYKPKERANEGEHGNIEEAKGSNSYTNSDSALNKFISYWKNAENNKEIKSGGWNKEKQLWFAHESDENKRYPNNPEKWTWTIAYGIVLKSDYLESIKMKSIDIEALKNGSIGITDDTAINEILERTRSALNSIKITVNARSGNILTFGKIEEKYKYALVDIYLNHGSGKFKEDKWKPFIQAASNNDLVGMLSNCSRGDDRRTRLFKEYLNS